MMKPFTSALVLLVLLFALPLFASTTANNDSCDIAQQPAATLLLPYFEVDFKNPASTAITTIFSVTNTSPQPQIANMTVWTDWGYPVVNIPIFLTGYDVQPINMYDFVARGIFAPGTPAGTSNAEPVPTNPTAGSTPLANTANPHFLASAATSCAPGHLPGVIPGPVLVYIQSVLTTGKDASNFPGTCGATQVGGTHDHAIGYITIDVVADCTTKNPASSDYYATVLLFDNVLTGDYQLVNPVVGHQYALGGPMVHIRAIPGGGAAGSTTATPLPYTFYDRLTQAASARTIDRRQPLPSTFAARWIAGGPGGFNTTLRLWREPLTGGAVACADYATNQKIPTTELVRFDEHENATVLQCTQLSGCGGAPLISSFPVTSSTLNTSGLFPPFATSGDAGGWMYLNLNNGGTHAYSSTTRASQNWVVDSLFADPTFAAESPATILGNGCSPAVTSGAIIQPAP